MPEHRYALIAHGWSAKVKIPGLALSELPREAQGEIIVIWLIPQLAHCLRRIVRSDAVLSSTLPRVLLNQS